MHLNCCGTLWWLSRAVLCDVQALAIITNLIPFLLTLFYRTVMNCCGTLWWQSGAILCDAQALDIISEVGDLLSLKYSRLCSLPASDNTDSDLPTAKHDYQSS